MMEFLLLSSCLFTLMFIPVESVTQLNATTVPQTFISPNYPNNYPRNTDEYWFLTTSALDSSRGSWVINLLVDDFLMESHSSCAYDYMEIFDGDSVMAESFGQLCGTQSDLAYSSSGASLYVHLHSDYSVTYKGFSISYWATYTAFAVVTEPPERIEEIQRRDHSGKIIGGVLGGVTGLCLIGLIIYCVCRRKYKEKERRKRIVKKVFKIDPSGKIHREYKATFSPKVNHYADIKPTTSEKSRNAQNAPPESYRYWGRQVPSPFRYIEPSYPPGHGSTPY